MFLPNLLCPPSLTPHCLEPHCYLDGKVHVDFCGDLALPPHDPAAVPLQGLQLPQVLPDSRHFLGIECLGTRGSSTRITAAHGHRQGRCLGREGGEVARGADARTLLDSQKTSIMDMRKLLRRMTSADTTENQYKIAMALSSGWRESPGIQMPSWRYWPLWPEVSAVRLSEGDGFTLGREGAADCRADGVDWSKESESHAMQKRSTVDRRRDGNHRSAGRHNQPQEETSRTGGGG